LLLVISFQLFFFVVLIAKNLLEVIDVEVGLIYLGLALEQLLFQRLIFLVKPFDVTFVLLELFLQFLKMLLVWVH